MPADHVAFALVERYAAKTQPVDARGNADGDPIPIFQGGVVAVPPDSRDYDIGEKLKQGDGVIVVPAQNSPLVEILRAYPALKEIPVPDSYRGDDLDEMTVQMLRDELRQHAGVKLNGTRDELVAKVMKVRANLADGEQPDPDEINGEQPDSDESDDEEQSA